MAIATRIDSFIAPTLTQQTLYDAIKQAFTNAGYPAPFDEYLSGTDRVVVYAIILDSTKVYGTSYLRIRITTTLVIGQQIYSTWVISNHTGTNGSLEITYTTLLTTTQVNFVCLNANPEYKLILLTQGALYFVLGYIIPEFKPDWWDLNAWNYSFIITSNTFGAIRSTALNPYGNSDYDTSLNNGRMSTANPQTNRRDILPGVIFYTQASQGIAARSSDDWVMSAVNGATKYDILQQPGDTKQYLVLNPANGGLAVRTA